MRLPLPGLNSVAIPREAKRYSVTARNATVLGHRVWTVVRTTIAGIRGTHKDDKEGLVMRVVAKTRGWSDQDIKDVVAFIKERR